MRLVALIASLMFLFSMIGAGQERIPAGQEGRLVIEGCDHPGVLHVPKDYAPGRRLPLIFFLHGSGGKPTSWPWKTATGGEGYFICGLPYGAQDDAGANGIKSDPATREAMVVFIDKVRAQLDRDYGIDQDHVILSGLSMGGWGVNFYGFIDSARDRYAAYAILAAGPRPESGVDFSVTAGLPVLLLNGETDQNLASAKSGKPALEKAGAIVEQVVIPGEGHVPSTESMDEPLAGWLAGVAKAVNEDRPMSAVDWLGFRLEEDDPADRDDEALAAYLAGNQTVMDGAKGRPCLLFALSAGRDRKGQPSRAARKTTAADAKLFCYPEANETALAARQFACFRFDLTGRSKKEHRLLHEDMAPFVILLDEEGKFVRMLDGGKLKSKTLGSAMMELLSEEKRADIARETEKRDPWLDELKKAEKERAKLNRTLARMRAARKPPVAKIEKVEDELEMLDRQRSVLLELLEPKKQD